MTARTICFEISGIDRRKLSLRQKESVLTFPQAISSANFSQRCSWSGLLGNALGSVLVLGSGRPWSGGGLLVAGFGYIVYRITCNDYVWVELDGERIRAKPPLYAPGVERSIDEIEDLLR